MYSVGWRDDPPYDMAEDEDQPSYFDWQKDDEAIFDALGWPLEGMLFDIENNSLWLDTWGEKPVEEPDVRKRMADLVASAPKLIPITGHRYLVDDTVNSASLVLSVWQSDIIVYAANLKDFLLIEFSEFFDLDYRAFSKKSVEGVTNEMISGIPFWGELILRDDP